MHLPGQPARETRDDKLRALEGRRHTAIILIAFVWWYGIKKHKRALTSHLHLDLFNYPQKLVVSSSINKTARRHLAMADILKRNQALNVNGMLLSSNLITLSSSS